VVLLFVPFGRVELLAAKLLRRDLLLNPFAPRQHRPGRGLTRLPLRDLAGQPAPLEVRLALQAPQFGLEAQRLTLQPSSRGDGLLAGLALLLQRLVAGRLLQQRGLLVNQRGEVVAEPGQSLMVVTEVGEVGQGPAVLVGDIGLPGAPRRVRRERFPQAVQSRGHGLQLRLLAGHLILQLVEALADSRGLRQFPLQRFALAGCRGQFAVELATALAGQLPEPLVARQPEHLGQQLLPLRRLLAGESVGSALPQVGAVLEGLVVHPQQGDDPPLRGRHMVER